MAKERVFFLGLLLFTEFFLNPNVSTAQTADETILFLLFGYEKGIWAIPYADKLAVPDVQRVNDCKFSISVIHKNRESEILTVDLSQVSEIIARDADVSALHDAFPGKPVTKVEIVGIQTQLKIRQTNGDTKESIENEWIRILLLPIERIQRASAYYRSTFCKGRAF